MCWSKKIIKKKLSLTIFCPTWGYLWNKSREIYNSFFNYTKMVHTEFESICKVVFFSKELKHIQLLTHVIRFKLYLGQCFYRHLNQAEYFALLFLKIPLWSKIERQIFLADSGTKDAIFCNSVCFFSMSSCVFSWFVFLYVWQSVSANDLSFC